MLDSIVCVLWLERIQVFERKIPMFEILKATVYNQDNTTIRSGIANFYTPFSSVKGLSYVSDETVEIYLETGLVVEGTKPENFSQLAGEWGTYVREHQKP